MTFHQGGLRMTERRLWSSSKSPALGLAMAALLAAACADELVGPQDTPAVIAEEAPSFAVHLTCTVNVTAESMSCDPSSPTTPAGGPSMNLIVGSQHQFVRMANDAPTVSGGVWSADVTVQNLTLQPMGTADGEAADGAGVRVFFVDEPNNGVAVSNHDGTDTFLGGEPAKYYGYTGAALGDDGILSSGETSKSKTWEFELNGAEEFVFSVLISTEVPDPTAYAVRMTRVSLGYGHSCAEGSDGK